MKVFVMRFPKIAKQLREKPVAEATRITWNFPLSFPARHLMVSEGCRRGFWRPDTQRATRRRLLRELESAQEGGLEVTAPVQTCLPKRTRRPCSAEKPTECERRLRERRACAKLSHVTRCQASLLHVWAVQSAPEAGPDGRPCPGRSLAWFPPPCGPTGVLCLCRGSQACLPGPGWSVVCGGPAEPRLEVTA